MRRRRRRAELGSATPAFRSGAARPHQRATGNSPRHGCAEGSCARRTSLGVGWQMSSCAYTPQSMQKAANTSARALAILAEERAAGCVTEESSTSTVH